MVSRLLLVGVILSFGAAGVAIVFIVVPGVAELEQNPHMVIPSIIGGSVLAIVAFLYGSFQVRAWCKFCTEEPLESDSEGNGGSESRSASENNTSMSGADAVSASATSPHRVDGNGNVV